MMANKRFQLTHARFTLRREALGPQLKRQDVSHTCRESSEVVLEALLPIEQGLLEALLAGELPLLESLRVQFAAADVSDREYTGSGFFTRFSVPPHVPRVLPYSFRLGDVWFGLRSNEDGGEAILWVKGGALDSLEAFARDGAWPQNAQLDGVHYFGEARDLDALRSLAGG